MPSYTGVSGLSGDGLSVIGTQASASLPHFRPFIYRADTGLTLLGYTTESEGHGMSGDGRIVVGNAHDPDDFDGVAYRWTAAGGMQSLGWTRPGHYYSDATAVSRDGSSVVGYSYGGGTQDAFVWSEENGMRALHGVGNARAQAFAVNNMGSIVVGAYYATSMQYQAAMWQNGSVLDLGVPIDCDRSYAKAVSDDGSVVVGYAESSASGPVHIGYIWTASEGASTLDAYVVAHGIAVPTGWRFLDIDSISADGKSLAGWGGFVNGNAGHGFVLTIPAPAGAGLLGAVSLSPSQADVERPSMFPRGVSQCRSSLSLFLSQSLLGRAHRPKRPRPWCRRACMPGPPPTSRAVGPLAQQQATRSKTSRRWSTST